MGNPFELRAFAMAFGTFVVRFQESCFSNILEVPSFHRRVPCPWEPKNQFMAALSEAFVGAPRQLPDAAREPVYVVLADPSGGGLTTHLVRSPCHLTCSVRLRIVHEVGMTAEQFLRPPLINIAGPVRQISASRPTALALMALTLGSEVRAGTYDYATHAGMRRGRTRPMCSRPTRRPMVHPKHRAFVSTPGSSSRHRGRLI